jgi:uncharacterized Zn-binding protein involved in type VI secretion
MASNQEDVSAPARGGKPALCQILVPTPNCQVAGFDPDIPTPNCQVAGFDPDIPVSVSSGTIVMGVEAALADDVTVCPKCKGTFSIKPDGAGAKHLGRPYAYHGDVTECGAKLISSL